MINADDIAQKQMAEGAEPLSQESQNDEENAAEEKRSPAKTVPTDDDLRDQQQEWDTYLSSNFASTRAEDATNQRNGPGLTTEKEIPRATVQHSVFPGAYAEGPGLEEAESSASHSRLEEGTANVAVNSNSSHAHPSSNLVTARAVADSGEGGHNEVIATADPVDLDNIQSETERKKFKTQIITVVFVLTGLAVLLLVILLILFLGVGVADDATADIRVVASPTSSSFVPVSAEVYVKKLLPNYTLEAIVDSPEGPQALAYDWLVNDPFLFAGNYTNAEWRLLQRFALATLFYATSGIEWAHQDYWLDYSVHECSWVFVESDFLKYKEITELFSIESACGGRTLQDTVDTAVLNPSSLTSASSSKESESFVALRLGKNNLQGSLPRELALLTSLQSIDVSMNALTGEIPSLALKGLSNLSLLAMFFNQLSGSIPSSFLDPSSQPLVYLGLYGNMLTGIIPSSIQNLSQLQAIFLGANSFSGSLPTELANIKQLASLEVEENMLVHAIPSELGLLSSLGGLHLRNNGLTNGIPSELGLLTMMTTLRLSNNLLSGNLPSELSEIPYMRKLYLDNNQMTGTIPSEFGLMAHTKLIFLDHNRLSGSIPSELGLLGGENSTTELLVFDIQGNPLASGIVPDELCGRSRLYFDCSDLICGCDCPCQ